MMAAALRMTVCATLLMLLFAGGAHPGRAEVTAPGPGPQSRAAAAPMSCDAVGDRRRADDCVMHRAVGRALDGVVGAGDRFRLRLGTHRSLRGTRLDTSVQVRTINRDGTAFTGRWATIKDVRWKAQRRDTLTVRAPERIGGYALRVTTASVRTNRSAAGGVSASGDWSAGTSALTAFATQPEGCPIGPDDLAGVQYFNEIIFNMEIMLSIEDGDQPPYVTPRGTFRVSLECPPPPPILPGDLTITLTSRDGSQSASCSEGFLEVTKDEMGGNGFCDTTTAACTVFLAARNTASGAVYSTTQVSVPLLGGNSTYVPQLEPAVTPICRNPIDTCLLTGTCDLTGRLL